MLCPAQPQLVFGVVVIVNVVVVVDFVAVVVNVVVDVVAPRNLSLKFGQNWVSNRLHVFCFVLFFCNCYCLKFGQQSMRYCWN